MLERLEFVDSKFKSIFLILVSGLLVYYHSIDVPFYLDDIASIVDNPAILNLSDVQTIWGFSPLRFVGYYSFALNFAVHGSDVLGYHIVNITIHLFASILIYLIVSRLLEIQSGKRFSIVSDPNITKYVPLAVALLFVLHPLNTQAVTYIVQRLASLSALFYLCSMYFYLSARMSSSQFNVSIMYVLTIVSMLLACLTKQNAFTLPFVFILLEACFFTNSLAEAKRLSKIVSSLFLLFIFILSIALWQGLTNLESLEKILRETDSLTRKDYLVSQILVVWKYIQLFFWPYPLNLDYDSSVISIVFSVKTFIGLLGHLGLVGFSVLCFRKLPIVAFGLLFYYLTLSVESSVIPISDLMFEHRTYLPNFGLLLAVIYFISCAKMIPNSLKLILLISSILVFGTLTWQRNDLWRDPVAFYDAAIDNSPGQSRNWVALSQVYFKYNEDGKALNLLRKELRKNQNRNNGVINEPLYVLAFWSQLLRANGLDDKADRVERIYGINKDSKTKQRMLLEQGNNQLLKSQYGKAVEYYNQVLEINPNHENAQINLGVVAMMEGKLDQAEVIFQRFPNNSVSRSNLPLISNLRKGNTTIGSMERKVFEKNH